jgi:integrase
MPRPREGYVRIRRVKDDKGKIKELIYARVTYTDVSGKRKDIERKAATRSEAKETIKQILRELEERGTKGIESSRMTFAQLADWFAERYLKPPKYVEGRKVSGRRTYEGGIRIKNTLVAYFGNARIREITHADLEQFKSDRLNTPVVHKRKSGEVTATRQRAIRSVNIELSLMRRIFNVALREGWIVKSPFKSGDSLISAADETRLLSVCTGRREHLRVILICALDTGMRRGEMFKLQWKDVDLHGRNLHVQAFNTKTMRERDVPISDRLWKELNDLYESTKPKPTSLVFGVSGSIKRSFATACRLAGITGLHLHDCRHAFATRLIQGGMPIEEVAKLLGHSDINTTFRYINKAPNTASRAIEILNRLHSAEPEHTVIS